MNDHIECKYCGAELEHNEALDAVCNSCCKYGPQQNLSICIENSSSSNVQDYVTSTYGRFGYLVMFFPLSLFSLMMILVLSDVIKGTYSKSSGFLIVITLLGVFSIIRLTGTIYYFFSTKPRFKITVQSLVYKGILGEKVFMWSEIKSVGLNFGGSSPFVTLLVSTKSRRWPYMLDVSGLKPNHDALCSEIKLHINPELK